MRPQQSQPQLQQTLQPNVKPSPPPQPRVVRPRKQKQLGILWAYAMTTVPQRLDTVFPRTLNSLRVAGFDKPHLFIDGATPKELQHYEEVEGLRGLGLEMTCRFPRVRTYANWILSLWELYARNPTATHYAMFQDDFVTYRNLKSFLEKTAFPERGYLNLYSFSSNEPLLRTGKIGWIEGGRISGHPDKQTGRGALGLVFKKDAVLALLQSRSMVYKPQDAHKGWKTADGAIVEAMNSAGWLEYIHNPSLVQHTGYPSFTSGHRHAQALTFRGEDFDALELLKDQS